MSKMRTHTHLCVLIRIHEIQGRCVLIRIYATPWTDQNNSGWAFSKTFFGGATLRPILAKLCSKLRLFGPSQPPCSTLWAQENPYHADRHCHPWESQPHTTISWWMLVIQSVVSSQTPSGACAWHWQVCLALLHQLYPTKSVIRIIAYPIPRCDLAINEDVWPGYYLLVVGFPHGVPPTHCCLS